MLPINASTANTEANSSMIALQIIANMRFIQDTAPSIQEAIANGKFSINFTTYKDCNITNLMNYYMGLGYTIGFPNSVQGFFTLQNIPVSPTRIVIQWTLPQNPQVPPVVSTQTGNYTMSQNNELVWADTTAAPFTVSLPVTPQDGWVETINDQSSNNPLTISGNGNNINGSPSPLVLTLAGSYKTLIFTTGYGWSVFPIP